MSALPVSFLQQQLEDAHARLIEARVSGRGAIAAGEEARDLVEQYVRGTADHLDALRAFMAGFETDLEAAAKERERLLHLAEETDADRRRFRALIAGVLRESGMRRARGTHSHFYLTTHAELVISNEAALPEEFVRTVPAERVVLKRKLETALKSGPVPGAQLIDGTERLVIR